MKNAVIQHSENKDFSMSRKYWVYHGLSQYNMNNRKNSCNMLTIKGVSGKYDQL